MFIKSIAQKIRTINDKKLKEYNVSSSQASLLELIERGIRNDEEITRKVMEKVLKLKGPSITNLINGLKSKGYIIRSTGANDARTFQIEITPKGYQLVREMEEVFEETEQQMLKGMTEEQKKTFLELLITAYKNLGGD
ncbi:transcriptional regulator, SarA/Rot family [Clostridium sp. JS66]|uniref:MarR family winged helix-turn-helix transcriptional regulator n=1 Tax=Clostridium sp. JS66 TaxID=3064705 RepID=UPI00298D8ED7|nr:MarR family transcriptional regulator [Clostridium sp. JS66]WPC43433.1 MarR family transcriptional regulator [Clostridium sp. JS66]